jgi:hypothetical protein
MKVVDESSRFLVSVLYPKYTTKIHGITVLYDVANTNLDYSQSQDYLDELKFYYNWTCGFRKAGKGPY